MSAADVPARLGVDDVGDAAQEREVAGEGRDHREELQAEAGVGKRRHLPRARTAPLVMSAESSPAPQTTNPRSLDGVFAAPVAITPTASKKPSTARNAPSPIMPKSINKMFTSTAAMAASGGRTPTTTQATGPQQGPARAVEAEPAQAARRDEGIGDPEDDDAAGVHAVVVPPRARAGKVLAPDGLAARPQRC